MEPLGTPETTGAGVIDPMFQILAPARIELRKYKSCLIFWCQGEACNGHSVCDTFLGVGSCNFLSQVIF